MTAKQFHTFTDDVIAGYDGVDLARLIRCHELSAGEVARAAIARARNSDDINAIVIDSYVTAERTADRLDSNPATPDGAFAGVPTFIKDQINVAGLPTKLGSDAHANAKPAKKNDPVAQQLFDMGLISLGKSTLPEYGFVPSTEFPNADPTRNPWNLDHTAGGSSGGAAALVAAGVVPIAHAADGGGSIRVPASCCGLVGMKPTRGRIPKSAMAEPFVGIVCDGVVTRTVRDTALYLSEAERLIHNRKLKPIGHVERPLDRPLRIGAFFHNPLGFDVDKETARETLTALELLSFLGHNVTIVEPPVGEQFGADFAKFWALLAALAALTSKVTRDSTFDKTQLTQFTQGLGVYARKSALSMPGVIRRLRKSSIEAANFFESMDVCVTPTTARVSPALGHLNIDQSIDVLLPKLFEWVCFTPWANATGCPSITLPLGFDEPRSLPIGILFSAAHGQERLLLELALQLEAAQPFRTIQN